MSNHCGNSLKTLCNLFGNCDLYIGIYIYTKHVYMIVYILSFSVPGTYPQIFIRLFLGNDSR